MPLIKRSSKAARATNIRRLIDEGYPPRQAVAIAYSTQRAARARNRAGGSMGAKAHRDAAIEAEKATRAQGGAAAVASSQAASDHARAAEEAAKAADSRTDFRAAAQAHDAAASAAWLVGDSARSERHTSAMDRAWRAATRAVNAAGGKRRNRAGTRLTARKPSARSYAERLRSNADDFHHHRIDYETFSGRNKRIWSEVDAAGKKTHEGVLKLLREEAGVGSKHRNRAGMADEDFKQRYGITTVRGVIYGRRDMLKSALSSARKSMLPVRLASGETVSLGSLPDLRERVSAYLDNDAFMRFRRGTIPARVADDIAGEISSRSFQ